MKNCKVGLLIVLLLTINICVYAQQQRNRSAEYAAVQKKLAQGWNTWNTRSVLSHVLLPEGFALNLGIMEYNTGQYLREALIGRVGEQDERIIPGPHAYNGSYTELQLSWRSITVIVETATIDSELVILVTPMKNQVKPAVLVLESGILWNRAGYIKGDDRLITAYLPGKTIRVYATQKSADASLLGPQTPYFALELNGQTGIATNKPRSLQEIKTIIEQQKSAFLKEEQKYGSLQEVHRAMQTVMAWDTIYEPIKDRVVTPVSRLWNLNGGGYQLFCWDTYFAGYLASLDNKELAFANVIEITREKSPRGFVPNYAWGNGISSHDRSQPPVGSLVVKEIYRKYGDRWVLEELYPDLLEWNRWWYANRMNDLGLLSWGSNPYTPLVNNYWESAGVNDRYGAALESGLDNSPMYDNIPFNIDKHILELADAGLCGLYIMDCDALAEIAHVLGKIEDSQELQERAGQIRKNIKKLWDEQQGFYYNLHTDTGEYSRRISPTNFYPLLGRAATQKQAQRMIEQHFNNSNEFWGEWMLPSIARNDPAYPDNDYWRGRIWAPMNFLVYLGLRNYDLPEARKTLAEKSRNLILKEWLELGHVHENYNAETGQGCDVNNGSDRFYHWGGLLGLICFIEEGIIPAPEQKLQ